MFGGVFDVFIVRVMKRILLHTGLHMLGNFIHLGNGCRIHMVQQRRLPPGQSDGTQCTISEYRKAVVVGGDSVWAEIQVLWIGWNLWNLKYHAAGRLSYLR